MGSCCSSSQPIAPQAHQSILYHKNVVDASEVVKKKVMMVPTLQICSNALYRQRKASGASNPSVRSSESHTVDLSQ
jgi:hypothetical protein